MWYVYIIRSQKNNRNYIGYTSDLKQRFTEHNQGLGGHYTSINRPFTLIYYEAYVHKKDASTAEVFYKSGSGREILKGKLKNYLTNQN